MPGLSKIPLAPNGDRLLTSAETAEVLRREPRTLEAWRRKGLGPPFIRIGGVAPVYRLSDILAWLDAHTRGPRG